MTKPLSALLLTLALAFTASAHAVLLEAVPAAHATLPGPKVDIRLRFNSRVDGTRSRLALVFPDQSTHPLSIARQVSPDTLNSQAADLQTGQYRLRWQVLAADGHITRGEVPFEVH